MRGRVATSITTALLLASASGAAAALQESSTTEGEEAAIREAVHGFKAALASGDSARALAYLHPDAVVYEGGHAETLAEYRSGHLRADMAFAAATSSETLHERVVLADDMALYLSESATTGEFRGRAIDSRGTESLVLVPTPDGWRIRHIHWSSRRERGGGPG